MVCSNYVRSSNVYKLTTIFVCVHQRVRGGGRECNQHILHRTGYYRRYVDDTFTIMPDIASAEIFLDTLNHCHPSAKFTMEVERNASLPFIGVEQLNLQSWTF